MDGRTRRVLVVTAEMGAGHREVAAELIRRLQGAGVECTQLDVIADSGRHGRRLKRTYRTLLERAPWVYGSAMWLWARWPRPLERLTAANAGPFEQLLADAVDQNAPDLIVSTYNLASQCLGRLADRGRIDAPVVTLVTDPGAHPYWVSAGIGLHLAPTAQTASDLRSYGAAHTRVVAPLLRPEFADPPSRAAARARLDLPDDARVVLLTAGSWAVGKLDRTLELVRARPDVLPVVLCGRDQQLAMSVSRLPGVRAVSWTTDVVTHLAAADVVVDNAGGLTCWEAVASGARVVLFRPLPGHGVCNARTLHALGLASWARTPTELVELVGTDPAPEFRKIAEAVRAGADAADIVLGELRRVPAEVA